MRSCVRAVGALEGRSQQWHLCHQVTSTGSNRLLKPRGQRGVLVGRNSAEALAQGWVLTGEESFTASFSFRFTASPCNDNLSQVVLNSLQRPASP